MRTVKEVMLILKNSRKGKGISVSEVADYIHKETDIKVSTKTVYGWEEGISRPGISAFIAMCNLYMIRDIKELFSEESTLLDVDITLRDELYEAYVTRPEVHEAVDILLGESVQK